MSTSKHRVSHKVNTFTESVIRSMTRLALDYNAINLAQGFPDFPAPQSIKDAACQAIQDDVNQYAITWGAPRFREAIAQKYALFYDWEVDPEREITVACGSTESMISSILGLVDPGDEILIFEPFYENYGPDAVIGGAVPVYVSLDPNRNWALDFYQLEEKIRDSRIRALILNTPNNPSGKVFTRQELVKLSELAQSYDFYVITDEIYEHIVYDGGSHCPIALLPGMRDRTITISGLSKTFSVTGWRIGYIVAPPDLTNALRKIHDFLTVGAAAPLQEAGAIAMGVEKAYYQQLTHDYQERRDYFVKVLQEVGFKVWIPSGAYYVIVDISPLTDMDDVTFVKQLIQEHAVAAVPGSSFYHRTELGEKLVRFAFCKTMTVLEQAAVRLMELKR
ncbi:MAG: aminotransferase class I/II-fold pyridoxal phosphate-dependent enzyme [Acidobacteriota bacterium]|nr:aminotransferase class I/II-fold pyridoxal phosphate-dependent enzyme [Acidobacteriota bacterium]